MRLDGNELHPLTPGLDGRWSPNGTKLVLDAATDKGYSDLFGVNADGTNVRRLTFTRGFDEAASWSPDGSKILFTNSAVGSASLL